MVKEDDNGVVKSADSLFFEIEKFRSPAEMEQYFQYVYDSVRTEKEYFNMALLKTGLFKEFLEEFIPLYYYSKSRFCQPQATMSIKLGNQGYDAIVKYEEETEYFEFTSFLRGQEDYLDHQMMIERGYSDIRFDDNDTLSDRAYNYKLQIIKNLKKKHIKDYSGINLMVIVDTTQYFEVYNDDSAEFVNELKNDLAMMKFNCSKLLVLIYNGRPKEEIDENLHLISLCK